MLTTVITTLNTVAGLIVDLANAHDVNEPTAKAVLDAHDRLVGAALNFTTFDERGDLDALRLGIERLTDGWAILSITADGWQGTEFGEGIAIAANTARLARHGVPDAARASQRARQARA